MRQDREFQFARVLMECINVGIITEESITKLCHDNAMGTSRERLLSILDDANTVYESMYCPVKALAVEVRLMVIDRNTRSVKE